MNSVREGVRFYFYFNVSKTARPLLLKDAFCLCCSPSPNTAIFPVRAENILLEMINFITTVQPICSAAYIPAATPARQQSALAAI